MKCDLLKTVVWAAAFCATGMCSVVLSAGGQSTELQKGICATGAPSAAVAACTELLERGSLDAAGKVGAYVNRGNAYDNLNDPESALKDYDSALGIDPRSAAAHRNKAATLNRQGRLLEALQEFDAAIVFDPNYAFGFASRADNLRTQARSVPEGAGRNALFERAIADHDRAISLGVQPVELAYRNRGYLHYYLGHLDAAISDFSFVIDRASDPVSYMARATVYADRRECGRAGADLDKVSALADPRLRESVGQLRNYVAERCK